MSEHPPSFELPTQDPLTNLLTPTYFRYLLRETILPDALTKEESVCIFLLDLDYFDTINATYGKEGGDSVLLEATRLLQQILPERALISRYGGDEFAGILPEMRLDDAFTLFEELRRQLLAHRWEAYPDLQVSCCVGLANFPLHAKQESELMREADQALYLAKSTGRNKVALPLSDSRMITKTSYYTQTQLERLAQLAKTLNRNEASVLREALDDVLKKYNEIL